MGYEMSWFMEGVSPRIWVPLTDEEARARATRWHEDADLFLAEVGGANGEAKRLGPGSVLRYLGP